MARVTVEDCILKIPNRFELVLLSSQRAREIGSGAALTVERDNDKNPVVALREIADETVELPELKESLIKGHQKVIEVEEDEEDVIDLMDGEMDDMEMIADEEALETSGMHEDTGEAVEDLDDDSADADTDINTDEEE